MKVKILMVALLPLGVAGASSDSYYNYLRGMSEDRAGHTDKALEAYEKVVQEDPQALQAYRDIAEIRLRMGQPDAALQAALHVKELAPSDPISFIFLGNVYVAQGNLAKAAEAYDQALKLDPNNLRALENLGNYYALLDPDKAITYYQHYIDLNSRDADIYFQMALVYQKKGNTTKALSYYKQSLELDADQLASHLAIADLYEQQKSTAAAIAEYKTCSQMQPTNPLVLMRLGNLYYRDGQWDLARQSFKALQTLTPQEASVYYWLARTSEEKKEWKDAAANAEKAYTLSQDAQFLPLVAYYMTLDHQPENAVKYLEKAKESDPTNANVYLFLGMNYLDLGKTDKAHEALVKGVSLYPKDVQIRFQLGVSEDRLGHFDEAMKQFQTVLQLDPKNAAAMNFLGYSWADKGMNLEEAEKLLRKAVSIEPDSGAYWDSLGWVRLKRNDPHEARQNLEKAALYSPDPLIFDHWGDAALADKHPEVALQAWSKALFMDPKNDVIRKKIQEQGNAYLKTPESKTYLKYMEGNLKQIQNLSGTVIFEGRLGKHVLHADGRLTYAQPNRAFLDVPATAKTARMTFTIQKGEHRADPANGNPMVSQMAFDGLEAIAQFLSGRLTDSLKVSIDSKTGVVAQFSRPNPSGGNDVIECVAYDFVDGLWVPSVLRLHNSTTGWEGNLQMSEWRLNESVNTDPFK